MVKSSLSRINTLDKNIVPLSAEISPGILAKKFSVLTAAIQLPENKVVLQKLSTVFALSCARKIGESLTVHVARVILSISSAKSIRVTIVENNSRDCKAVFGANIHSAILSAGFDGKENLGTWNRTKAQLGSAVTTMGAALDGAGKEWQHASATISLASVAGLPRKKLGKLLTFITSSRGDILVAIGK